MDHYDTLKVICDNGTSVDLKNALTGVNKDVKLELINSLLHYVATLYKRFCAKEMELQKENWAKFSILVEQSANLSTRAVNTNDGDTVLHERIQIGCLKSVLLLLSRNANPNVANEVGHYPIHAAAESTFSESLQIIKALVAFGADINVVNCDGKSARHLCAENAVHVKNGSKMFKDLGARRCTQAGLLCSDSCDGNIGESNQNQDHVKFIKPNGSRSNNLHVLCLDGGGIRGLVLTQILLFLEQITGMKTRDMFQFFAGTSTGGILALGLTTGRSVLECQGLYFQLKDTVFKGVKPYEVGKLETFYKNMFGSKRLEEITQHKVIVTATIATSCIPDLHIYRNYTPSGESYVWEAAKITGAAPYFFRMEHPTLVDGGLVANNPSLDALSELSRIRKELNNDKESIWGKKPKVLLSLGTGFHDGVNLSAKFLNLSFKNSASSTMSLSVLPDTAKFFIELATASCGPLISRAKAWCDDLDANYFRFNPALSREYELDEIEDSVLVDLLYETRVYMISQRDEVQRLCELLIT